MSFNVDSGGGYVPRSSSTYAPRSSSGKTFTPFTAAEKKAFAIAQNGGKGYGTGGGGGKNTGGVTQFTDPRGVTFFHDPSNTMLGAHPDQLIQDPAGARLATKNMAYKGTTEDGIHVFVSAKGVTYGVDAGGAYGIGGGKTIPAKANTYIPSTSAQRGNAGGGGTRVPSSGGGFQGGGLDAAIRYYASLGAFGGAVPLHADGTPVSGGGGGYTPRAASAATYTPPLAPPKPKVPNSGKRPRLAA